MGKKQEEVHGCCNLSTKRSSRPLYLDGEPEDDLRRGGSHPPRDGLHLGVAHNLPVGRQQRETLVMDPMLFTKVPHVCIPSCKHPGMEAAMSRERQDMLAIQSFRGVPEGWEE